MGLAYTWYFWASPYWSKTWKNITKEIISLYTNKLKLEDCLASTVFPVTATDQETLPRVNSVSKSALLNKQQQNWLMEDFR